MQKDEFIKLCGTDTIVDYPFGNELQKWNMKTFSYDAKTDTIKHNRITTLIVDVFIKNARNPHAPADGEKATHG